MSQMLHPLLRSVGLAVPEGLANAEVRAVTCDSRMVRPGTLFLGLPGQSVDGGCFWPQALEAGAAAAVIGPAAAAQRPPGHPDAVVVVEEPVAAWAGLLAASFWHHPSSRFQLIGVTGTNGKTTTTHLIEHLSKAVRKPAALFGTMVNRWPGTSTSAQHTTAFADQLQAQLALAAEAGTCVAAMEVSSHALDQQRVRGCDFAGAVFTNLSQDHLDYHPSMEAYFEAKCRLFHAPLLRGDGVRAVVNSDDDWGRRLAADLGDACWRSSLEDPGAELHLRDLQFSKDGVSGTVVTPAGSAPFRSILLGRFNLMNALQAIGALVQRGHPLKGVVSGLPSFRGVAGRMEQVQVAGAVCDSLPAVLVDYAHTPDGLEKALEAARPFTRGRLICVFGCGGDRDRSKRPQMGAIAARLSDRIVVTSDNPRTEDPQRILDDVMAGVPDAAGTTVEGDRARAIALGIAEAGADDLVLIAGKGHEDYQIIGSTKIHFDDREEAEKALRLRLRSRA
ncbi:UDP-N-acetylmuramoyl-L-alanyl-D-glutamate--2,6-diaminopimelate ligase [Synechococcus sp. RSCCF101]|uniref:UDP-N-acetylmuramoyl-L-alanyl-D-glutamate--2, 6-diaminopimelate ligase n=1 Tax=Synechococcus sp. RSCCF101 TaxID=2511069 RepID=UPI001247F389|nr:UDP-N-acetylmuramoyl-L-alanyl-D-glutamate--2,6-diaminopimelate ligase [Synechococcus sp. RSCCF101]QEY33251.1 UDP-N-acetylmuramoyl-L-alanyl-D-glutamate--2,6-diaminopimelate ligase [Synechococcus sp. RSCCF101]